MRAIARIAASGLRILPIIPRLPHSTLLPILPITTVGWILAVAPLARPRSQGGRQMCACPAKAWWFGGWAAVLAALLASGCSALNPQAFRSGDSHTLLPEAKAFN